MSLYVLSDGSQCLFDGEFINVDKVKNSISGNKWRVHVTYKGRELPIIDTYSVHVGNMFPCSMPTEKSLIRILQWCKDNEDITRDLFIKYDVDYISPISFKDIPYLKSSDYLRLIDEIISTSNIATIFDIGIIVPIPGTDDGIYQGHKIPFSMGLALFKTDPRPCFRAIYKGRKIPDICCYIVEGDTARGVVYDIPNLDSICIIQADFMPEIFQWCKDNEDITRDLFIKYDVDYITPSEIYEIYYNPSLERYSLLIDELLRSSRLEWN